MNNLFADLPTELPEELVETIASNRHIRIERIVSHGHASPEAFWYDQEQHEWVVLLTGRARLRFEGEAEALDMGSGGYIDIPAHRKHRVEWTTPDEPTIWLAIHHNPD